MRTVCSPCADLIGKRGLFPVFQLFDRNGHIALRRVLPQIQSEGCPVLPCPAVTADGDQRLVIEIKRSVNVPLRKSAGVHQISEKRPRLFAGGTVIKAKAFQTLAVHRQRLLVDVTFQHQQTQYQLVDVLFLHLRKLGNLPGTVHIHLQLLHGGIQLAEGRTGNQPGKQRKRADVRRKRVVGDAVIAALEEIFGGDGGELFVQIGRQIQRLSVYPDRTIGEDLIGGQVGLNLHIVLNAV